jgi:coenzyme F420-dependent glucose-6-phosphate dehydrogenase
MYAHTKLSFARTHQEAVETAWDQWLSALLPSPVLATLRTPAEFDAAGAHIRREDVEKKIRCSDDPEQHLEWLRSDLELGFSEVHLHNVCRAEQERFIDVFGKRVLPGLAGSGAR